MLLSISYSEILLKGYNRRSFEQRLVQNLLSMLSPIGRFKAKRMPGRVLLSIDGDADADKAIRIISRAFGIEYVSAPLEAKADIDDIERAVLSRSPQLCGKAIKVDTRRSDKSFPLKSPQVNERVGSALVDAGCSVDLDHPDATISIEILHDRALISLERIKGPGGLPAGSSGKAISLLSGGIDSPVASWLMMKRGCSLDFLHLHQPAKAGEIAGSKIRRQVEALRGYWPTGLRLLAVPYTEFYKSTLSMDPKVELVLFRRFLFHLTNALADEHGYQGVVTGDSLGQVASQTIGNIFSSDEASKIPVFRPLIGFNKQEIVDLAMKIGTFDISIEPYKDCCSLVAQKNPSTRVPLHIAKKAEEGLDISSLIKRTIEQAEMIEV
ncbi:MAG: tRNA uracil 4-sulfurtransferase ThiI [Candidatus Micrarchaeota archaeon]